MVWVFGKLCALQEIYNYASKQNMLMKWKGRDKGGIDNEKLLRKTAKCLAIISERRMSSFQGLGRTKLTYCDTQRNPVNTVKLDTGSPRDQTVNTPSP